MDAGTTVWRAYTAITPGNWWLEEGVVTEIVVDGVPLVRWLDTLVPLTDQWRESKTAAKRDAAMGIARQIGKLQVVLDELRDECLHEELASMEVPA
jgi:hypothetical protein